MVLVIIPGVCQKIISLYRVRVDNSVKTILKSYEMKCRQQTTLELPVGAILYNNILFRHDHYD